MAIVRYGRSLCLLCWKPLINKESTIAFTHFIEDESDPLGMYSDGTFHKSCFDAWEKKKEFLERYKAFLGEMEKKYDNLSPTFYKVDYDESD